MISFQVNKVYEMIKDLLAIAPQMVFIPDSKGDYPLHAAIHNHHSCDIIYEIFEACPEVGSIRDAKTSLIPFKLAAIGDWQNVEDQMTITYKLLQADPHSIFT